MKRCIRLLALTSILGCVVGCGSGETGSPLERGQSLLRQGDYDDAIAALDEAIRLDPSDADAYVFRGRAYQIREQAGDLNAAIDDFSTAIDLDPSNHEAYYSRAIALRDRGKATGSEEDARLSAADHDRARELDPELAESLKRLPIESEPFVASTTPAGDDGAEGDTDDTTPGLPSATPDATTSAPQESTADVIRRLEAEAAAAGEGRPGESSLRSEADRDLPLNYDRQPDQKSERPRETSRSRRLRREHERRLAEQARSDAARQIQIPLNDSPGGLPAGSPLDPQTGSSIGGIQTLTPAQGNIATPPGGGTQPPVATSPFSTQGPLTTPTAPGGQMSPYQTPYQSPFPQQAPRPTGYVPPQFPTAPAGTQPQSFFAPSQQQVNPLSPTQNRPATNRSPAVRRDGYLFP